MRANRIRRAGAAAAPIALLALVHGLAVGVRPAQGDAPVEPGELRWERIPLEGPGEAFGALALDAAGARLAAGGERGVLLGPAAGPLARAAWRGPVHDVAFLPDGDLLAATAEGLYRIGADGRATRLRVGAGEEDRSVLRIAVGSGWIALAGGGGVYLSRDARSWRRPVRLPLGESRFVALRAEGAHAVLWTWIAGALWTLRLAPGAPPAAAGPAERVPTPLASRDGGALDAAFDLPGAEAAVLFPAALLVRGRADAPWRLLRPALPPGAAARRLAFAFGRYWLASDAGLLAAQALAGPWRRAAPPAGHRALRALIGREAELVAAAEHELLRAAPAPPAAARAPLPPADPDVREVQRAALAYLSLDPRELDALRRGVARRGWLPILSLRAGHARARDRRWDRDQSFLSGETRELYDREKDLQQDLEFGLTLSWDLGDAAFHPDQVDVSREQRAVIALRDDVLDEVTQLYFERRRVLGELAGLDPAGPDAGPLRERAAELAAGIDAWTGGWFSRHAPPP